MKYLAFSRLLSLFAGSLLLLYYVSRIALFSFVTILVVLCCL